MTCLACHLHVALSGTLDVRDGQSNDQTGLFYRFCDTAVTDGKLGLSI